MPEPGFSEAFRQIVEDLPPDWTDMEVDIRLADEDRYIDASVFLSQVNARPYSKADWHFRIGVANKFGHGAAPESVRGALELLDRAEIDGEMRVKKVRQGRAEVVQMWGRPESVRQEYRRRRSL